PSGLIMAEVVIMKMISRTRNTSVSGVTLISAMMPRLRPAGLLSAMRSPARRDGFQHAPAADAQRGVDAVHARLEVVVEDDREDADGQAERGGDEGLRDASGHHREAAGAGERDGVERADDAHHGAEEPDERRCRPDGAEHPEVRARALHLLEAAFGGDALELGHGHAVLTLDQVGVDAARRAGAMLAGDVARR